ncbi:hypothetical protein HELRODRAFT_82345, partial [Helobdella robusta]|uniref:PH domain-containing protein n=1 Tax=Helobdella robusta TaxID=6412 RepID=T1G4Q9_HELRO
AKTSVKHFPISVTSSEITFGLAKFEKFSEFLEHFMNRPLIGGIVFTAPVLVPKHKQANKQTVLEPTVIIHGEMSPTSPTSKSSVSDLPDLSVKTGFLIKQGGLVKNWKERWVVADSKDLKYYQREEDFTPKGTIDLRDCTCCRKTNTLSEAFGKENTFILMTPWRTFLFSAATVTDMESWVAFLKEKLVSS